MLRTSPIVAFVATRDADRARAFYETALGLTVLSDDPFALVLDANGTMLRVQKVREIGAAKHTVLGWSVDDIHATIADLASRGVVFERYEALAQDEEGIWASPSGALIAWFKDPDGNTLSLTQFP